MQKQGSSERQPEVAAHTPGQWVVVQQGVHVAVLTADGGWRVCWMASAGNDEQLAQVVADANLIAAAPTLAAALQDVLVYFQERSDVKDGDERPMANEEMSMAMNIEAALKKAGLAAA